MINRLKIAIILSLTFAQAETEFYLITGTTTPNGEGSYDSTLIRVTEDGSVVFVADLMPGGGGTAAIVVSYDARKAILIPQRIPKQPGAKAMVLDLETAVVAKSCEIPEVPGTISLIKYWLGDVPIKGVSFNQYLVGADITKDVVLAMGGAYITKDVVLGMSLDPTLPCDKSFEDVDPNEVRFMIAHGSPSVAHMVRSDSLSGSIDQSRNIRIHVMRRFIPFGQAIPEAFLKGLDPYDVGLNINNSNLLAVCVSTPPIGCRNLVYRKRDKTWHTLPSVSQLVFMRGFGKFIVMSEAEEKGGTKESAGRSEWRKDRTKTGPNQEEVFDDDYLVYPGRLHIYDSDTEQLYTIETKQADSEVVLIDANVVYYRVCDRLYSAPITSKGLGTARLLAKAEEIRDAHWAFIKQ